MSVSKVLACRVLMPVQLDDGHVKSQVCNAEAYIFDPQWWEAGTEDTQSLLTSWFDKFQGHRETLLHKRDEKSEENTQC